TGEVSAHVLWPQPSRVGRHLSSLAALFRAMEFVGDGEPLIVEEVPSFDEVMANDVGYYLNPAPTRG
ncbi:MAG TPA: hypothetical protein PKM09_01375, partial [Bacillota bacterium]|nr:hypothetical protein [Bacillota bacterium]